MIISDQEKEPAPTDRTRFQFSLQSLFILTTACAVLLSFAKTFPNAAIRVAEVGLMSIGPLLFFLGSLLCLPRRNLLSPQQALRSRMLPSQVYSASSLACSF